MGKQAARTAGLPLVDFSTLLQPKNYEAVFLEPQVVNGNVSSYELFVINSLVRQQAPATVFEFGTFNGRTALNLAANCPPAARIFTLDLPHSELEHSKYQLDQIERTFVEKPASGELFRNRPEAAKITQLLGDSAKFDYGPYLGKMDFVFVDASHAYEYVLNDSQVALRLLREGRGTILWHDYGCPQWWPGVTRALEELKKQSASFANLVQIDGTSIACRPKT